MMKEIAKIKLSEMRQHMKDNARCKYFIIGPLGNEIEIEAVTQNFWCYPRNRGSSFIFIREPGDVVTVKKEVEE